MTGERDGKRRRRLLRRLALAGGALVAVGLVVAVGVRVAYGDRVLPSTTIGGLDLGGRSPQAAGAAICSTFADDRTLTLTVVGERFVFGVRRLGYRCDPAASTARARRAGREGPLGGLWSTVAGLVRPRRLEPVARVDGSLLSSRISAIADDVDRGARRGEVVAAADAPEGVRVVAPRAARKLDRGAAAAAVRAALLERRSDQIALGISPAPAPAPSPLRCERLRVAHVRTCAYRCG